MITSAQNTLSTGAKVFLGLAAALSLFSLVDFVFYGYKMHTALAAVGFAFMAYGTYKNGLHSRRSAQESGTTFDTYASYSMALGVLLAGASFAMKHLA